MNTTTPTKLIFPIFTEYESLVVVVEITPKTMQRLRRRQAAARKLQGEDEHFAWVEFYDTGAVTVFGLNENVETWIEENEGINNIDAHNYVATDKTPAFGERERLDTAYMVLDGASCFWAILLKHSDQRYETCALYDKDFRNFDPHTDQVMVT